MNSFTIKGSAVELEDLIRLRMLALDLHKVKALPTRSKLIGEQRSKFRGQGREFIEMKHYQSGDDVRQIDWRQTAKKQSPFVRVMEEDRHSEHVIWLPLSARMFFGTRQCFKSVMACHWAAFLIWRFIQLKHPVRLVIEVGEDFQETFRITSPKEGAHACQLITRAHEFLTKNFHELKETQATQLPHWSGHPHVWILSDFQGEQFKRFQDAVTLKPASTLTCLQTLDTFDTKIPRAGQLPVKHKDHNGWIRTQDQRFQEHYQEQFEKHQNEIQNLCWQNHGQHHRHLNFEFNWQEVQQWPLHH